MIFVLEGGRVVGQGGYAELVGRTGCSARMAALQGLEVA